MTEQVKMLYKSAMKNKEFLKEIKEADNDSPNFWDDHNTKVLFATVYYGWLVGRYKSDWQSFI